MKFKIKHTSIFLILLNTIIWYLVFIENLTNNLSGTNLYIPMLITLFALTLPLAMIILFKLRGNNKSTRLNRVLSYVPSVFVYVPLRQLIILELNKIYEEKKIRKITISKSQLSTSIIIVRMLFIILSILYFVLYCIILILTYNMSTVFYNSKSFWLMLLIGMATFIILFNATYRTLLEIKLNKININTIYRLIILSRQGYKSDLRSLISGKNSDVIYELE